MTTASPLTPHAKRPPTVPAVPPLAALVASLATWPLPLGGRLQVVRVEATEQGLLLRLRVTGMSALIDGLYPLGVTVLDSSPEETACRLHLQSGRGLAKLLNRGLGAIPPEWLNALLGRFAGDAVRMEGDRIWVRHSALWRELLRRRAKD